MNKSVLIIDDDLDTVSLIRMILEEENYEIFTATDPMQGLQIFHMHRPSVLVLDLEMPVMHGLDILRKIKPGTEQDFSVIILTGYGHDENVKNCYELGAYAFLAKPVHLVELKGLVRNAMLWEEYKRELKFHKEQLEELVAHRTRKLHQEIELRELTEQQLLRANKVKDKILSILTLDLRAPLSNIVTHLNFIHNNASAGLSAELETQISDLYDEAKSTWLLTENIFQWARCQKGEIVAHPEHYNLKAIINDTLLFYSTAISHKEIQVDMDIDEQLEIFSDRKIVYILIQNLLSNAVKYSEQGGVISISSRSLPETVEIMIQDFGAGISAESLDDIFDVTRPFSTLGTANEKGSGLGLVICQELAQIINAKISVESTVGKGTLVTLNLPVSKP